MSTALTNEITSLRKIFTFNDCQMRTTVINNQPYFCLVDLCKILDLVQVHRVASTLVSDDRTTITVTDSLGRTQNATFVNEGALYQIIFQSRKAEAKQFQRWVTNEVLPEIRKTGRYNSKPQLPDKKTLAQWVIEAESKVEQLQSKIQADEPLTEFGRDYLESIGDIYIYDLAKILHQPPQKFYQFLRKHRFLGLRNQPLEPYAQMGIFKQHPSVYEKDKEGNRIKCNSWTTKVTPEGVKWFKQWFRKNQIKDLELFKKSS